MASWSASAAFLTRSSLANSLGECIRAKTCVQPNETHGAPSTRENGCMRVIPGSHTRDQIGHTDTHAGDNMLSRGQVVNCEVDETRAVDLALRPGEMSLHHVRLIHGSEPNPTDDRRIGFAIRYIPPYVRQTNGPRDSAALVRGRDRFGNFAPEPPPAADLHPAALEAHRRSAELHGQLLYRGTDRAAFS